MSLPIMGCALRRRAALLAVPGLLVLVLAAVWLGGRGDRTPVAADEPSGPPPAPPRVIRAYSGPAEGLSVERLEGLDDRQRAAARQAIEDARRRLERSR